MKLHILEIQAFGPFADKEKIAFSELGENPLFLIDGPTGAGKSSILHAISYALYGQTTDSARKGVGLRCDHAHQDMLTSLSLEFSIRDDRYRIIRVPVQMRPALRGQGETEQKATAELVRILPDGVEETIVAKKVTEADTQIERIVGLTPEQFRQVMVLPQGKFRELLLAKSDERQEILSTLFQTEVYKQIEQRLKDKAGDIERKNAAFETSKKEALSDVELDDVEQLFSAITAANEQCTDKQKEKADALKKQQQVSTQLEAAEALKLSFSSRASKQKNHEKVLEKADTISTLNTKIQYAEKAIKIVPIWQSLKSIVQDIKLKEEEISQTIIHKEQVEQRVTTAKHNVKQAETLYKERDQFKADEVTFLSYQEKLTTLSSLESAFSIVNNNYQIALSNKDKLNTKANSVIKSLENITASIDALSGEIMSKATIATQKIEAKTRMEQRNSLEHEQDKLAKLTNQQAQQQTALAAAERDHQQKYDNANRIEMLWFSNQAAILADKLKDDQPCVVCGSVEHPKPAAFSENIISQQLVEEAREEESLSVDSVNKAKIALAECESRVLAKQSDISILETSLADYAKQTVAEVELTYKALEQQLTLIEEKETALTKVKQQQISERKEQATLSSQLKQFEADLPILNTTKSTAESELNNARKALPEKYRDSSVLTQAIVDIQKQITKVEKGYEKATIEQTEALKQQSGIESTLSTLITSRDTQNNQKQQQAEKWQQALSDSEFATQLAFEDAHLIDETLQAYKLEVKHYDNALHTLKTEITLLNTQLKDKQEPDLESLQQQQKQSLDEFSIAETSWSEAEKHKAKLETTHNKIISIETQQSDIKQQYEIIGTLAKAASGKGNVRVSLERFVLGNLLDSVLSIASQRLHRMSKGQYRLIRQNESLQKRNATAGLDLAIDDAYTGKTRPVSTLSGGESFMASLALALGLSDVVQERSGGIQLDTLFIDEGFGSLDQESLQLAINTLIDLQSTGRTIGIISHVSELKEQMAQRIEVSSSRDGSTIKIVT